MGGGGRKGGGYDYRQHTHASDDPEVQNACREVCERVMRGAPGTYEDVETWGYERQTYKRYCWQYGLSFEKLDRSAFRIEKLDPNAGSPFAELAKVLERCSPGKPMRVSDLLWEAKSSEPDLWRRLGVKGVTNTSEKKFIINADEVKRYFDVSSDWQYVSQLGSLVCKEYAKPLHLTTGRHGELVQNALEGVDAALRAVPWKRADNEMNGKDLFCAFNELNSIGRTDSILQQMESPGYKRMLPGRERLPAFQRKAAILEKFDAADVLVICGATGCGKTTQLPQLLMEMLAERDNDCRIICTQPRRISATSVAQRVAVERGEALGGSVGYQIRFEHKASAKTSLLYCTVGILLRHLATNPNLDGVGVVVVDEVHERDVHTDFTLLILRDLVMGSRRGSLKLVLMSATINAQGFMDYFLSAPSPQQGGRGQRPTASAAFGSRRMKAAPGSGLVVEYFEIPGKTNYPIEEFWVEDILESVLPAYMPAGPPPPKKSATKVEERNLWAMEPGAVQKRLSRYGDYCDETCDRLANVLRRPVGKADLGMMAEVVLHIAKHEGPGAVLIFVPGWQDISDCIKELEKRAARVHTEEWRMFPLHSMVPPAEQSLIFEVLPEGQRKIIVSTNIAETSITVEDVVFVIDSGLIKGSTYAPTTNVATLEALQISRSNMQQRRGRAGRCMPGKFYKMYSQLEWEDMPDSMSPEMQRTPVEELCLQVKALDLSGKIEEVLGKAIDPPVPLAVTNALSLLCGLGALTSQQKLTPLGWKLALLPIHPSLGKMLLIGSLFDCVPELLSVCGTLSSKSPFVMPFGKEKEADAAKKQLGEGLPGDHLLYAKVVAMYNNMGYREANDWCFRNFLSDKSLAQIEKTRKDLHQYVVDLKLRPRGEKLPPGDHQMREQRCAELLFVLASSLPLATRPPSQPKFKCLEAGHQACAVHPSSLMEHMSSPKRKMRHQGESYGVICWFSRLKTAELYLHDVSVLADPLPLLLLSPAVTRRAEDKSVFEIAPAVQDVEEGKDDEVDDGASDEAPGLPPPPLLIKVRESSFADSLWQLRGRLGELIDRIVGQPPVRLPSEVGTAFRELRTLVQCSYRLHGSEPEACESLGGGEEGEEAGAEDYRSRRNNSWGRRTSGGGGKGDRGGEGYPWWEHIKGKGKGKRREKGESHRGKGGGYPWWEHVGGKGR